MARTSSTLDKLDFNLKAQAKDEQAQETLKDMISRRNAAKDLFTDCENQWRDSRAKAEADQRFYLGDQVDSATLLAGQVKSEPMLSSNQLPNFVKQIESNIRQLNLDITVSPTDENGSEELADIYNGLIRHIQQDSRAHQHYLHAAGEDGALVPGFGYLKVEIEDVNPRNSTGQKKLTITSAYDPFAILPDFSSREKDYSDADYWFEVNDFPPQKYKQEFPFSIMATMDATSVGINLESWGQTESNKLKSIRVLRYWYKETIDSYEYELADGTTVNSLEYNKPREEDEDLNEDMTGKLPFPKDDKTGEEKIINRKRRTMKTMIKWMDLNGAEILREGTWPGEYFPFVAVIGPQLVVNGRRDIRGNIRYAKDAQKMINYTVSSAARRMGSSNKSPWVADAKSITPYQTAWQSTNTENWSVLPYDAWREMPGAPGGFVANPQPVRADQTAQVGDLIQIMIMWEDRLKATMGIYDAGLGVADDNVQSGIAIQTLAQQGQNANLHFTENLIYAVEHLGTILIDLIPKVYTGPQTIRIVNPDTTQELVKINQLFQEGKQTKIHDLSSGDYTCKINAGPAYATKKSAELSQLLELIRIDPNLTPVMQDLIVGCMDFDGVDIARERLVKMFATNFPQLQTDDKSKDVPPQAQAQLAQQGQMIQKLTMELQQLSQEYQQLQIEKKAEITKFQAQLHLEEVSADNDRKLELIRAQNAQLLADKKIKEEEIKTRLDHNVDMHKILLPHLVNDAKS